jgi:Flp pilus assembly protein TadG
MKIIKKIKNRIFHTANERGQVAVIVAISLIAFIGIMSYVIDVGSLYETRAKLQNAVDAAALAGAQDLPNTSNATATANQYIQLNGYQPSDISITFSDSNQVINVSINKNVAYNFAGVFGLQSGNVYATASAKRVPLGAAFGYTLFSGSVNNTLILNGTNQYIGGSSHTNQNFIANGTNITITGACEAMGTLIINGTGININNRYPNSPFVDMPDFSETIRLQAEAAGQVYSGNKIYNGSSIVVNQPIYVNGNVTINGCSFVGKGCILATGNIIFNGSNLDQSTSDAVCFYSKNGSITVNGSSIALDGILYAPKGSITMNGSNQTIHGRVIGNTVTINGSGLTIQSGTNELKSLPSSIQLIK